MNEAHSLRFINMPVLCLKACGEMIKPTEGIAGNSDFAQIFHPLLSFTFRERGGDNFKILLIISLLNIRFWGLAAA